MKGRPRGPGTGIASPQRPKTPFGPVRWVIAGTVLLLPVAFLVPSEEAFRTPKDLLFRLEWIVLLTIFACAAILGGFRVRWREAVRRPWVVWITAMLGWGVVTTLTSIQPSRSATALLYAAAMAFTFAVTVYLAKREEVAFAAIAFVPAVANVIVLILQIAGLWTPVPGDPMSGWRPTGLIGNPNDTGGYFVFVAVAATALALASPRWRLVAAATAVSSCLGILMTATLSAMIGLTAGLTVLAGMKSWRLLVALVVAGVLIAALALGVYPPVQQRAEQFTRAASAGDLDRVFSFRFLGYLTAWEMVRENPILGLGPGSYAAGYFDYRQKAEERHPFLRTSIARAFNFGEAHNDHLQILAQTGFPGYAVFLAGLYLAGRISFRRGESEKRRFAHFVALPLVVSFAVMALAQFPLELTALLHTLVFYLALAFAWEDEP